MSLWQKVKQLDSASVQEIVRVYASNNIPIELRDICAVWIEGSIKSSAERFCIGLRKQIQDKLENLRNSESSIHLPFYVAGKLIEFQQSSLSTCDAAVLHAIHKRFEVCLESERYYVNKFEVKDIDVVPEVISNGQQRSTSVRSRYCSTNGVNSPSSPSLTTHELPRDSVVGPPTESSENVNFINHPTRLIIDRGVNDILVSVGSLEESSHNLSIKCHEIKQLQELQGQLSLISCNNGSGIKTSSTQTPELQTRINMLRCDILQVAPLIAKNLLGIQLCSATITEKWLELKTELDMDLAAWTVQQKFNANGKPIAICLRSLQNTAEYLMEIAWKLKAALLAANKVCITHPSLIKDRATRTGTPDIPEQVHRITNLIKRLVQDSFVLEHQPCQVLKTNTRFHVLPGKSPMEVCLLVGDKLGLQLSPPSVTVSIVDEAAVKLISLHGLEGEGFRKVVKKGKLLPENARLDFCEEKRCSSAVFRQISLKDFYGNSRSRSVVGGKDQAELVTEEKFALLFRSEFSVGDIEFQIWRLSLPIIITTHGSQESLAWAGVTWDNAFSRMDRIPFELPDYVNWEGVSGMLNDRFFAMVGAYLTQENLNYLAERLSMYPGFPNRLTWSEVCKTCFPGKRFSFWDWFYEGAKLIEQHLKDAWKDGYVKGFIGKESSENMLCSSACLPGTFLLRFSDSTLGGISIVWLHSDGTAYSLSPFKSKDLTAQPFVEKINQETLHFVYPNTKKEDAFRKYYEEYEILLKADKNGENVDRYIRFRNKVVIDNPTIPRFCPSSEITEYQRDAPNSSADDFNIDFDELFNACLNDLVDFSQDSSYQSHSSQILGHEQVSQNSDYYETITNSQAQRREDDSIYFHL